MAHWCLTTSPDNFARTAALGWRVQGIKSRRRPTAAQLAAGDTVTYYCTGAAAFGAVVEVTGSFFEDHDPVWVARQEGEDYPWRFPIRPLAVVEDPAGWLPVIEVRDRLEHLRRWPPERWSLGFQGNIRAWPSSDTELVRAALANADGSPVEGRGRSGKTGGH